MYKAHGAMRRRIGDDVDRHSKKSVMMMMRKLAARLHDVDVDLCFAHCSYGRVPHRASPSWDIMLLFLALLSVASPLLAPAAVVSDPSCIFETTDASGRSVTVNLATARPFHRRAVPLTGIMSSAVVGLSPCQLANYGPPCDSSFAMVVASGIVACFSAPPATKLNATAGTVITTFLVTHNFSSYLFAGSPRTLAVTYVCSSTDGDDLTFATGFAGADGDFSLVFNTAAACPVAPLMESDPRKSTELIVGITVGVGVVLMLAGVGIWLSCRNREQIDVAHDTSADYGRYGRY